MSKKLIALVLVATVVVTGVFSGFAFTDPSVVQAQPVEQDALNQVVLDVTFDPEEKTYSMGGLSFEQLEVLGAPVISQAAWNVLAKFDNVSLELTSDELLVSAEGERLASVDWDEETRRVLLDLAVSYVPITNLSQTRIEEWAENTSVFVNFRNSPRVSRPAEIQLTTPIQVNVSLDQVYIEGFDTGAELDPVFSSIAETGEIDNATICWVEGQLFVQVNGNDFPELTVYEEGLDILDDALDLGLGQTSPYFEAIMGADVSFEGAPHSNIYCEK